MAARCVDCAEELSLGRWLLGHVRCAQCEAVYEEEQVRRREREQAEYDAAVGAYAEVLSQLRAGVDLNVVLPRIRRASQITPLAASEVESLHAQALTAFLDELVEDEALTSQEDQLLGAVIDALGVGLSPSDSRRYILAACNAGLMPRDAQLQIVLNRDEVAYWRTSASLLSERVVKEYRTNYHSMSVPIGQGGFRYRAGQSRGRHVVVGTTVEVADQGWLTITSQRVVFTGARQALEFPLKRLLGVNLFGDGIGLQVANRKTVPSFRTGAGANEVFAGVLNAATSRQRGTFVPVAARPVETVSAPPLPRLLAASGYRDAPTAATSVAPIPPRPRRDERGDDENARPSAEQPMTPDIRRIFHELHKFPGTQEQVAQAEALYALGAGSRAQMEDMLRKSHDMALRMGLPPSLTPLPLDREAAPVPPVVRELPPSLEDTFERLVREGLTVERANALRDDYRRGQVTEPTLAVIHELLQAFRRIDAPAASTNDRADPSKSLESGQTPPPIAVYQQASHGSRTRELLDILAGVDRALSPAEIGSRMRSEPDAGPISKGTVRAAIRNLRRVEKGLREEHRIAREVLVVDSSAYAQEGSNRYSLRQEDKAAILRLS